MKNFTLKFSVEIKASQKQVFNYLTDWEKQSEWILFTIVSKTSESANQIGTTLSAKTGFGPFSFVDTMTLLEYIPDKLVTVEHTGKIIRGRGVFQIEKLSKNKCIFTWLEITPVPFGFLGVLVTKPVLKILFGFSLKKLRKNLENKI